MIEVLESLRYKNSSDLTQIGVQSNNVTLPSYEQNIVNGRYQYSKTYAPEYLEGATNYNVIGYESSQTLIRDFISLRSSYNPTDLEVEYLSNVVYSKLTSVDIPYFIYWYDVVNVYSPKTIKDGVSAKALYGEFGDSVGTLSLYTPTSETVVPTSLGTSSVKAYNRVLEMLIADEIRETIDQAYQDVNVGYAENISALITIEDPSTAHGAKLVVDVNNTTRYNTVSSGYISALYSIYAQLMYLSPVYANPLQLVSFTTAPFFNSFIEGESVVVDKLGNKVSIDQGSRISMRPYMRIGTKIVRIKNLSF